MLHKERRNILDPDILEIHDREDNRSLVQEDRWGCKESNEQLDVGLVHIEFNLGVFDILKDRCKNVLTSHAIHYHVNNMDQRPNRQARMDERLHDIT